MVLWEVYGKGRRRHQSALPRLHFAQVVATAQVTASRLFLGFSDDRRFVLPVLVLFVVFVLVIIIVGISRRYRVAAHDGDEAPNVVRGPLSHDRLLRGCHDIVSARVRARQSVCIAALQRSPPATTPWGSARRHRLQAGLGYCADDAGLILKARRCSRFASRCVSVVVSASLSLSMMS